MGCWTCASCTRLYFRAGLACARERRRGPRISEVHTAELGDRSALFYNRGRPANVAFDPLRLTALRTTSVKPVSIAPENNNRMSRGRVGFLSFLAKDRGLLEGFNRFIRRDYFTVSLTTCAYVFTPRKRSLGGHTYWTLNSSSTWVGDNCCKPRRVESNKMSSGQTRNSLTPYSIIVVVHQRASKPTIIHTKYMLYLL